MKKDAYSMIYAFFWCGKYEKSNWLYLILYWFWNAGHFFAPQQDCRISSDMRLYDSGILFVLL